MKLNKFRGLEETSKDEMIRLINALYSAPWTRPKNFSSERMIQEEYSDEVFADAFTMEIMERLFWMFYRIYCHKTKSDPKQVYLKIIDLMDEWISAEES